MGLCGLGCPKVLRIYPSHLSNLFLDKFKKNLLGSSIFGQTQEKGLKIKS